MTTQALLQDMKQGFFYGEGSMNERMDGPRLRVIPVLVAAGLLIACLVCPGEARAQDDARVVSALNAASAIRGEWRIAGNNSIISIVCETIRRQQYPNLLCFGYLTVDDLPEYSRGDIVFWVQNSQPSGTRMST